MNNHIVFTFIGRDQPGLVRKLSSTVAEHGGNWLESRMSLLGGQFAGAVRVAIVEERQPALIEALSRLGTDGLQVVCQAAEDGERKDGNRVLLQVIGNDRPGIVLEVSRALASQNINVIDMQTALTSAAMTADPLFEARVEVEIPERFDRDALEQALDDIADSLSVEIDISPLTAASEPLQ